MEGGRLWSFLCEGSRSIAEVNGGWAWVDECYTKLTEVVDCCAGVVEAMQGLWRVASATVRVHEGQGLLQLRSTSRSISTLV